MFSFFKADEPEVIETPPRYFISLGAGQHQIPVIKAAREMGYSVIAVDQNLSAPGFEHADIHLQCSITRPGRIVERIQESFLPGSISGVGCRSFGRANLSSALIARRFGTPGIGLETLKLFKNKRKLKERLAQAGVLVPRSYSWRNYYEKVGLRVAALPLLVRPAIGHAKQGISLLTSEKELLRFIDQNASDKQQWLVEEFIRGQEITVMGYCRNGIYHHVCTTDKITSDHPPLYAEIMHRFPSQTGKERREIIETTMQAVVTATGMKQGPMVAEFILGRGPNDREDKLYLIECAPEIGGELLADYLVPAAGGKNYFQQIIALLTRNLDFHLEGLSEERAVLIRFILPKDGRLLYLRWPESLESHPGFLFARELKAPGDITRTTAGNLDRLAVFGLTGPASQLSELESAVEEIASSILITYDR
ncbi:MAG: ATP-grasp domain-containing protein [Spirochaetales bacterium]|nr:ATP-grasp domain-containing protein [Spirochaetales bacterium]